MSTGPYRPARKAMTSETASSENTAPAPSAEPSPSRLLLVGGGHAHVEVVRRLASDSPLADVTLVSPAPRSPYSGMLPGYVSGRHSAEALEIDVEALCRSAGVRFIAGTAASLDPATRLLRLTDGRSLPFDLLSLDIGSQPAIPTNANVGFATKPIAGFVRRIEALDQRLRAARGPFALAVVGGGLAGVEIAFALRARSLLIHRSPSVAIAAMPITLYSRSARLVGDRGPAAERVVRRALYERAIEIVTGANVTGRTKGILIDEAGRSFGRADDIVWATSSAAPDWLAGSGLALDPKGFVIVDHALRSVSHPIIFAAGDVANLPNSRPKAGVFAVRAGPILAANLQAVLTRRPLKAFHPQRRWLALIDVGDGTAIATKYGLAMRGRWADRWKRRIDQRFVARYRTSVHSMEPECA